MGEVNRPISSFPILFQTMERMFNQMDQVIRMVLVYLICQQFFFFFCLESQQPTVVVCTVL